MNKSQSDDYCYISKKFDEIVQDPGLSFTAKGLLLRIISSQQFEKHNLWISPQELANTRDGIEKIRIAMDELAKHGILIEINGRYSLKTRSEFDSPNNFIRIT